MHNRTIIFDDVYINHGEKYFENWGFFVCSDDAYYVFMWSVQRGDSVRREVELRLMIGDEVAKHGPRTMYRDQ